MLITAWQVLDDLGCGDDDVVEVLTADDVIIMARVLRTDPLHDLAVMQTETPLPGSVSGWFATDWVPLNDAVAITGAREVSDLGHDVGFLDIQGFWAGGTTREGQIPLGRVSAKDVSKGMSGAPVRRISGDRIVGVVSGRYNSADGWMPHSFWAARSEDVQNLLSGIADVAVEGAPDLGDAVDLVLSVTDKDVRLTGPVTDVSARHHGVSYELTARLDDVRLARKRGTATSGVEQTGAVSLRQVGHMLAESFLPGTVADALAKVLRRATAENLPVRIGIDAPNWPGLPWEAMSNPVTSQPLALCPHVIVFRRVTAPEVTNIPGPLRILVAISSPERGGANVLNYERELRNVVDAVRGARAGSADVRIVPFATTAAIRAALDEAPVHVLHMSCHGGPGTLELEREDGAARAVTAAELLAEAIPAGRMPPVVCLAACYTDMPASNGAPSLAADLIDRGASVVIGTESAVTDGYATALFARIYQELAQSSVPDIVSVAAAARRIVQTQLATSPHPRDGRLAGLEEWSVVRVLAGSGATVVFDPTVIDDVPRSGRRAVGGLPDRGVGEFVGRRQEQRSLPAVIARNDVGGVVLYGMGGVGKTTLAAELVREMHFPVVAVCQGELSVDTILTSVTASLRHHLAAEGGQERLLRTIDYARRLDEPWHDRFTALRKEVLSQVGVLVVLDNFEDNLNERSIDDAAVAELLADWVNSPGLSRLLITTRFQFTLPADAHRRLQFSSVGPLSLAETSKMIWSLPALERLSSSEIQTIWRLVGGHPRSLEYLDALRNDGVARYNDVTNRLAQAVTAASSSHQYSTSDTLDIKIAETQAIMANEVLLDELLRQLDVQPGAYEILLGTSVYRKPVDINAILFQVGDADDSAAHTPYDEDIIRRIFSILDDHKIDRMEKLENIPGPVLAQMRPHMEKIYARPRPPRSTTLNIRACTSLLVQTSLIYGDAVSQTVFVHRWTASELARQCYTTGRGKKVQEAHARAAEYWLWRAKVWPGGFDGRMHDQLEARYHLLSAQRVDIAADVSIQIAERLHEVGAWDHESKIILDTIGRLIDRSPRRSEWLRLLGRLALVRGDYTDTTRSLNEALTIDEELGDRLGIALDNFGFGTLKYQQGNFTSARFHLNASLEFMNEFGSLADKAPILYQLGMLAQDEGNLDEAEGHYTEVLAINSGEPVFTANVNHQLGRLAQDRGNYADAELRYKDALKIYQIAGQRRRAAATNSQLGILAELRGRFTEARQRFIDTRSIYEEIGNRDGMAITYQRLGILARKLGAYKEAERLIADALTIDKELGNQANVASHLHELGILAHGQGSLEKAEEYFAAALDLNKNSGNPRSAAENMHHLGILAHHQGDRDTAEKYYNEALAVQRSLGNRAGEAATLGQLGILARDNGDYAEANRYNNKSHDIYRDLGEPVGVAIALTNRGCISEATNELVDAVGWHIHAAAICGRLGAPVDLRALARLSRKLGPDQFRESAEVVLQGDALVHFIAQVQEVDQGS